MSNLKRFGFRATSEGRRFGTTYDAAELGHYHFYQLCTFTQGTTQKTTKEYSVNKIHTDNKQTTTLPYCRHFSSFMQHSLQTGVVPAQFKTAVITPGMDINTAQSYRQSKIFERIVGDQIQSFIDLHSLLLHCQSAYRRGFSTETGLHLSECILILSLHLTPMPIAKPL